MMQTKLKDSIDKNINLDENLDSKNDDNEIDYSCRDSYPIEEKSLRKLSNNSIELIQLNPSNESKNESTSKKEKKESTMPFPVRLIVGNEACERFSFYGLRAILTLYMVEVLLYSEEVAVEIFAYTQAFNYFFPLLGGFLSDSYWGKYNTILRLSLIYVLGGATLAFSAYGVLGTDGMTWGLFLGLLCIAIGTGGIKPCVSAFGADQFSIDATEQISTYFHIFYFAINVGSISSIIVTPLVRSQVNYGTAFFIPAILLTVAVIIFWCGRDMYRINPPSGSLLIRIYSVVAEARRINKSSNTSSNSHWLDSATISFTQQEVQDVKDLFHIIPVFATLPMFWAMFDQQGSVWTLQAKHMNREIFGLEIQPEQIQVLNPLLILLFIPIFEKYLYPYLRSLGSSCNPLSRMAIGMIFSSISFICAGLIDLVLESSSINISAQIPQYVFISIGEILVSITGLEFAYSQAPLRMKSLCAALYLLTTAVGDLLAGLLYNIFSPFLSRYYLCFIFSLLMIVNLVVFLQVRKKYVYISLSSQTLVDNMSLIDASEENSNVTYK